MGFILSSLLTLYVSTRVGRTESELEPVIVPIRNTGWKESDIRISIGIRVRIAGHYLGPRIRIGVRIMVRFWSDLELITVEIHVCNTGWKNSDIRIRIRDTRNQKHN